MGWSGPGILISLPLLVLVSIALLAVLVIAPSRRMLKDKGHTGIFQDSPSGSSFNVKILVTLADGERCVRPQELVAEDLGQEDVVGLVLGLKPVAADGSVGASEVARVPGLVQETEGVGNVHSKDRICPCRPRTGLSTYVKSNTGPRWQFMDLLPASSRKYVTSTSKECWTSLPEICCA
jgi:hypothetical protein